MITRNNVSVPRLLAEIVYAELDDRDRHGIVEEELLASPSPVCDRCTMLKEKVITLQKQID